MAFKEVEKKVLTMSPSLIDKFVTMTPAKCDRPLKPHRIVLLKKEIDEGRFTGPEWASCVCREDGKIYRVNGKHTSTIFSQMNGDCPKGLKVVYRHFEADTLKDVAELYTTFDSDISKRSLTDIIRIVTATDTELHALRMKVIRAAVSGIAFANDFGRDNSRSMLSRAEELLQHKPFVLWLNDMLLAASKESDHMRRAPVVGTMYLTFQKSQKDATRFWNLVRTGDGEPGTPNRKLERWLLTCALSSGRGASDSDREQVTHREMMGRCIAAWNSFRKGGKTDLRYSAEADLPEVI
jgi:hypothetical protein